MMLTVFTPTFNRGSFLPRIYENLASQEVYDIEWLIADDGSTDDTEAIVARMMNNSSFPIEYYKKENGGKHSAHNLAVAMAKGELFVCLDSDDIFSNDALNAIINSKYLLSMDNCGLVGYKSDSKNNLLCKRFGEAEFLTGKISACFDKAGEYVFVFKTSVLRNHLFPVIPGEKFIGECILYDKLAAEGNYLRPVDKVLQICEYQPDGLSSSPYRLMIHNPTGYQIYHAQRIDLALSLKERLGHAIRYQAFRTISGNRDYLYVGKHRLLVALMRIPGIAGAVYYKYKAEST